jgi:hypothetical protein
MSQECLTPRSMFGLLNVNSNVVEASEVLLSADVSELVFGARVVLRSNSE